MTTVAIIGLGTMGLGLAQVFASAGFQVLATDTHAAARDAAQARLAEALDKRVITGKLAATARAATLANFSVTGGMAALAPASLAIEAIVEDLSAKQALFAELETILATDAVLATNTSSLSVTAIARGLQHPGRCLGLHFFNPPAAMQLVELVAHDATSLPHSPPRAASRKRPARP